MVDSFSKIISAISIIFHSF